MTTATTTPKPGAADGLPKVEAETAQEILERYEASDPARELVEQGIEPARFLERLFSGELFEDAITFLAYALPRREALWWGLECVREITPEDAAAELTEALAAAQAWIDGPTDELRRAAMVAAEKATYGTPAGCLALAVFFSEGSMAPPDCPEVPVGEWFCARTAAAALLLASLQNGPDEAPATAKRFAERGVDVARTEAPWEKEG